MADVWIFRRDLQAGDLPDLCLKCGRPAVARIEKAFPLSPWNWLGFAPLFPRVLGRVPACERHQERFDRPWVALTALAVLVASVVGFFVVAVMEPISERALTWLVYVFAPPWFVALVVFLAAAPRLTRVRLYTPTDLRLTGVSAAFATAYRAQQKRRAGDLADTSAARWAEPAPALGPDEAVMPSSAPVRQTPVRKHEDAEDSDTVGPAAGGAAVWLRWQDCRDGKLPALCLCCGLPTRQLVELDFSPRAFFRALRPESDRPPSPQTHRVPLCEHHRGYWRRRRRWMALSLTPPLLAAAACAALVWSGAAPDVEMLAVNATVGCCLPALLVRIAQDNFGLRPRESTWEAVRMEGVSGAFAAAYERQNPSGVPDLDRAVRDVWGE